MSRFLTIPKFCQETGYSKSAVYKKIKDAKTDPLNPWAVGQIVRVAGDGKTYLIDMLHFDQWVLRSPHRAVGRSHPSENLG